MKLLRFEVEGLDLMKEPIAVDFYARQQVREDDKFLLHHLVSNIYLNTANAFIGINASGKTTLLRVTNLVLDMLNNRPLNHAIGKEVSIPGLVTPVSGPSETSIPGNRKP